MNISGAFELFIREHVRENGLSADTEDNYRQALHHLLKSLSDKPVEAFTYEDYKVWRTFMEATGTGKGTQRTYLSKLKNVLKFSNRRGITGFDIDLIKLPKNPRVLPKYITPEEVGRLLRAAECPRDEAFMSMMFSNGLRVGEVSKLRRRDVEGNRVVVTGKGNKQDTIVIDERTRGRLESYLTTRVDKFSPLFLSYRKTNLTVGRMQELTKQAAARAGIEKVVTPHVLRHSFATDLLNNDMNLRFVQHHMRHEHISTTQIYTHIVDKEAEKRYNLCHTVV